jgi:hypothetical protein
MKYLEIAQDLNEVSEGYDLIIAREAPGYQVAPEVNIDEAKQVIEARMGALMLGFTFDQKQYVGLPSREMLHIDSLLARPRRGLNLHETLEGSGQVDLIAVRPSKRYYLSYAAEIPGLVSKRLLDMYKYYEGDTYRGKLEPGMKTVFSEGIKSPLLDYEVGPTAHKFMTSPNSARTYNRYFWSGDTAWGLRQRSSQNPQF